MSTFNKIDVTCPACGEEFTGILWTAVHAGEDPILKDILFGGELNILMCPKCSHAAYRDHFVLYQDPKAELIAYIYPPGQSTDQEFLHKSMLLNFNEAQKVMEPKDRKDYEPILVFGLETFVKMMKREELRAEQSQIAEAVCKEHQIPYVKLRPSRARALRLMRVLPLDVTPTKVGAQSAGGCLDPGFRRDDGHLNRADMLAGLDRLLAINPALNFYDGLRQAVQKDPQWQLLVA